MNDARDDTVTGVVVVAGGMGTRLGAGRPKALVEVGGESLVAHAVRRARAAAGVEQVVVVAPQSHLAQFRALLPDTVEVVPGGVERTDSVAAGLAALRPAVEIVLVHDAARGLAPTELFERVAAEVVQGREAVVPGLAVVDTVKQVDDEGFVVATPQRSTLRAVQTPQGFRRSWLARAHASGLQATDDAALVEAVGGRVVVVPGEPRAMKVTTPADLAQAERLASAQIERVSSAAPLRGPWLVVLGGLPGVGKSALARALADVQLLVDRPPASAEWNLHRVTVSRDGVDGSPGHAVAYDLAADQLRLGACVVADTTNPTEATRQGWRALAERLGVVMVAVEVICGDAREHRRRVEERASAASGDAGAPTWEQVQSMAYQPADSDLRIDTATLEPHVAATRVLDVLGARVSGRDSMPL